MNNYGFQVVTKTNMHQKLGNFIRQNGIFNYIIWSDGLIAVTTYHTDLFNMDYRIYYNDQLNGGTGNKFNILSGNIVNAKLLALLRPMELGKIAAANVLPSNFTYDEAHYTPYVSTDTLTFPPCHYVRYKTVFDGDTHKWVQVIHVGFRTGTNFNDGDLRRYGELYDQKLKLSLPVAESSKSLVNYFFVKRNGNWISFTPKRDPHEFVKIMDAIIVFRQLSDQHNSRW